MHHEGSLPFDRVFIKVGGDKGQGSTKITLQVCNTKKPNSPLNTLIIGIYEGSDTYTNLGIALDGIGQQLEAIDGTTHTFPNGSQKEIELCGSGDFDFMSKTIGTAGAAGKHPCTYCKIPKSDMQFIKSERGLYEKRTIENLTEDYLAYCRAQCDPKKQSLYSNVIAPMLLHLEPSRYNMPSLHIVLGGVMKMHTMAVSECHCLDLELLLSNARKKLCKSEAEYKIMSEKQDEVLSLTRNVNKTIEKIKTLQDECEGDILLSEMTGKLKKVKQLEEKLKAMEKEIIKIKKDLSLNHQESGPLCQHLEKMLQLMRIHRQVYHGRSFVGM